MEIKTLTLRDLMVSEDNVRTSYDDESIAELAESIKSQGLLSPLVVMPRGVGYQILAGHRRYKALLSIHQRTDTEVQCVVKDPMDSAGYRQLMLVENLQRSDLDPIDEANAYQSLVDAGMTRDAIAKSIGKSGAYITKRMALLKLPGTLATAVKTKDMSLERAYKLSSLSEETLKELDEKNAKDTTTVAALSDWDIGRLERAEANKITATKLANAVAQLNNVVNDLPDTPHKYIGRYDGNNIDQYMQADDDVVVNRKSFVLIYKPAEKDSYEDEWDAWHETVEQIRKAHNDELKNYMLAVKLFTKSQMSTTTWPHKEKTMHYIISNLLQEEWAIMDILSEYQNLTFEDDDALAEWLDSSYANAMTAFLTLGWHVAVEKGEQWALDILAKDGIVKPVRPDYPPEPEHDEDEDDDIDDDDETSYVDDTPDESLAYEGSQYDPYE